MISQESKKFQGAIILSTLLHLILIAVFFFGFPAFFEKLPEEKDALTFEILPLSEIVNVKNESKSARLAKEAKKSRLIKKTKTEAKPEPKTETPTPPKKEIEKKVPEKAVIKEKALTPPKAKNPTPKPKKKPKSIPKKDEDAIDAILKNLEQESEGSEAKISTKSSSRQKAGDKYSRGMDYDETVPLSITENLIIKQQIKQHWREPVGAQNLETVKVVMIVYVEEDGTIEENPVIKVVCPPNSGSTCTLVEESARRAIKQASPLENLLPNRYDSWKKLKIEFSPNNW